MIAPEFCFIIRELCKWRGQGATVPLSSQVIRMILYSCTVMRVKNSQCIADIDLVWDVGMGENTILYEDWGLLSQSELSEKPFEMAAKAMKML